MKKKNQIFKILSLSLVIAISSFFIPKPKTGDININTNPVTTETNIDSKKEDIIIIPEIKVANLSFIGDCTLGTDVDFNYEKGFDGVFDKNNKDYSYFFKNVVNILNKDDLTIANLETTFTDSTNERKRPFNFKGDKSYVNILLEGSVEVVNLANNHILDYYDEGKKDTIDTLKNADVAYYGENIFLIKEIDGIKIGFAGFDGFDDINSTCVQIKEAMDYFKDNNIDIKIVSFHWGIEREKSFNQKQQTLGRYAIDSGADLVVGHHPHILQGIEKYNDKYIVYSLGNFVFGGNNNPDDKDSMILQLKFYLEGKKITHHFINIIPVSISSVQHINNYQPIPVEDEKKIKILKRINDYSKNFTYDINK